MSTLTSSAPSALLQDLTVYISTQSSEQDQQQSLRNVLGHLQERRISVKDLVRATDQSMIGLQCLSTVVSAADRMPRAKPSVRRWDRTWSCCSIAWGGRLSSGRNVENKSHVGTEKDACRSSAFYLAQHSRNPHKSTSSNSCHLGCLTCEC